MDVGGRTTLEAKVEGSPEHYSDLSCFDQSFLSIEQESPGPGEADVSTGYPGKFFPVYAVDPLI